MTTANHDIHVAVETVYRPDQSDPEHARYAFAYTVTIHNRGRVPATLLTRHWLIEDGNGKVEEVKGDGVVGEHPYLRPGESFRYTSGALLETPVGTMRGTYRMVADDGETFDAPIPAFLLSLPNAVH